MKRKVKNNEETINAHILNNLTVDGNITAETISADNGFIGNFTNGDWNTVIVVGGIITDITSPD